MHQIQVSINDVSDLPLGILLALAIYIYIQNWTKYVTSQCKKIYVEVILSVRIDIEMV